MATFEADSVEASEILENLPESQLGTKEYWDQIYQRDLENFKDHGDEGEIWFGTSCERRVIGWLKKRFSEQTEQTAVMDLGCGNGHFTAKLLEAGFKRLGALDYSEAAIKLAKEFINETEQQPGTDVSIYAADILQPESIPESDKYAVIVDKGTFDAISLSGKDTVKDLAPAFKATLKRLSCGQVNKPLFIITSCNWTGNELKSIFGPELVVVDEIEHSSFTFGGKKGQDVSTVIFEIN